MSLMKIIPGASFALLLLIASLHGKTQGSCVIPTIKIASVTGQVISKHEGVPKVTLQLRDWKDQTKTLMEVLTDDDGNFDLKNIKEGKYLLVVKREMYSSLYIPIRVEPGGKNKGKRVLIHLAPDYMDACSEGGVELKDGAAPRTRSQL